MNATRITLREFPAARPTVPEMKAAIQHKLTQAQRAQRNSGVIRRAEYAYVMGNYDEAERILQEIGGDTIPNMSLCNHVQHIRFGGICHICRKVFYRPDRSIRREER